MFRTLKTKRASGVFSVRNILACCVILSVVLFSIITLVPAAAQAQTSGTTQAPGTTSGPGNCGWMSFNMTCIVTEFVQWGTNLIVTLMAFIGGLFIAVEVWFIDIILQINNNVLQQTLVQTGFTVTLALANLGFVLGIIVIALATILRRETYGIKQMLWKLVVAAILVNFSLVICGAIIGFSTTLTNYFMAPLSASGGFASSIGSVFQPQQFFAPQGGTAGASANDVKSIFAAGNTVGSIIAPLITIITALIFIVAIVIVLATFFLMLLVRYVYLAFLLIFMPLAWVCWIFPSFQSHWSRWWSTFLRWTFFPPLVVFFLYLVIQTGNVINSANKAGTPLAGVVTPNFTTTATGVVGALSAFFGSIFTNILTTALNDVLLIGLAVGGLIAANSMSIKFADVGMKAFGKAKDGILGYAGKQGKRAVSRVVPAKAKEKLEAGQYRVIPKRVQSWMGRGLGNVEKAGGQNLVDKEAAWAREKAKNPEEGARLLAGSLNTEQKFALLKQMTSQGDINKVKSVNGKSLDELLSDKKYFTNAGQDKLHDDINRTIGSTVQSRDAGKAISTEVAKEQPKIDMIDKNLASLEDKSKNIERAEKNARIALRQNPNKTWTDADGAVTGKAGTTMNVKDFADMATKRYVEVEDARRKAKEMRAKIVEDAKAKATIVDKEGTLGTPGVTVSARELQDAEVDKLVKTMSTSDAAKVAGNAIYGKGDRLGLDAHAADALGESFARAMAAHAPQFVSPIIKKMKSEPLQNFSDMYRRLLANLEKQAGTNERMADHFKNLRMNFEKSLNYNMIGGGEFEGGGEDVASAAKPTPPPSPSGGNAKT